MQNHKNNKGYSIAYFVFGGVDVGKEKAVIWCSKQKILYPLDRIV